MTKHLSETERRGQILRSARSIFIEKGYLAARVEDVARRAGLSKGAVYFYFSSKRELFLALVRDEHENTYSFLDQAEHDDRAAAVKLIDLGQKYLDYFAGLKSPPRFFLMMSEQAIRDDEIREELHAVHLRFVDAATRILAQGMAEGTFRDLDPLALAQILKALIDGFAGQSAIGVRPDKEKLAKDGIGMILHGLLRKESP
ncbi:MAG: TetR/AcrR family transcriptional regulator [Deltaproteobacteria bacterium]|nr:TetR/AcrR family transcriptional regulator [Deltaproteobacteria bacterium]MBW2257737.1 TetR/AcrR family transcriptional regulator [Deltaproteobacteria bacterium]